MRQVSVTELKNKLSQYLRLVKRGETVEVLERSVPIARIYAVDDSLVEGDAHLQRLLRDGIVTPARNKATRSFLKTPPVPCKVDPVRVLLEERGDR